MTYMKTSWAALLLAAAIVLPVQAQTTIDKSVALKGDGRIDIDNLKGRVHIRAWNRDEVKLSGTLGKGVEKLEVSGGPEHLEIRVVYPRSGPWGGHSSGPTDLQLMVPVRAELDIETVSADVDIEGVAPVQLSIDTVSGTVKAIGAPKRVSIETVSGAVQMTVNTRSLDVQTVSGAIRLGGRMQGELALESVSADIDVRVLDEQVDELTASTVSGRITIEAALAPKGEIHLESVSGDLDLALPATTSAVVSGETFSGRLKAPGVQIEKRQGPGMDFTTRYGNGAGKISLETFSGDAEVRWRP